MCFQDYEYCVPPLQVKACEDGMEVCIYTQVSFAETKLVALKMFSCCKSSHC